MPVSPALLGLFFCLAAAVLLTFVSISAPTWNEVSFLTAGSGDAVIGFGVFGHSKATHVSVGYRFNPSSLEFNDQTLNTPVILNLTKTLILHPIAAGMAGLAFFCGLCGVSWHRAGTVIMVLLSSSATVVCLMAFLFDMVLFGIARRQFRDQGIPSQYDNACWLTLAALVAIFLGFSLTAWGTYSGQKKRNKSAC